MLHWTPILYDIAQGLESLVDPEGSVDRVLELMGNYVPYDRCVLLEVSPVLARTITIIPTVESSRDVGRLTHRTEALLSMLIDRSPQVHRTEDMQTTRAGRSHLAVPVFSLSEIIALLLVERAHSSYDETHVAFLSVVAAQIGAYLTALKTHHDVRVLTDNCPDILSRYDRDLRHIFVNAAIEAATGLKPQVFIGRTIAEVGIPKELAELWTQHLSRVLDTGQPDIVEFSFNGPRGLRHYTARVVAERSATGEIHGALAVTSDCTRQRETEAALRAADHQKDAFLATMAHELRNPLAPMRNAAKIIAMQAPEAPKLQWASQVIERQLQHMSRLLDDLFDISRITRKAVELRKTRADLASIIAVAIETSRPLMDSRSHQLTVNSPPEKILVDADPTRLAQVFANLLNNAAKYTAPGGHIRVTVVPRGNEVAISIADNGEGIAREQLRSIFELFVQVNRHEGSSRDGLGIGLALAERLVQLHGGTIEARSDGPGHGSEFIVRLPISVDPPKLERQLESIPASPGGSRLRILIVDDNQDSADSLALILQFAGNITRAEYDGRAAIEVAQTFQPDLVLLDVGMPGVTGLEACRQIRSQPWGARLLMVAVSGYGQERDRRQALEAGFDHHLTKPVNPDQLLALCSSLRSVDQHPSL
jgi:PAS domain S-box-containing protein